MPVPRCVCNRVRDLGTEKFKWEFRNSVYGDFSAFRSQLQIPWRRDLPESGRRGYTGIFSQAVVL